jgi:hypothetical protein
VNAEEHTLYFCHVCEYFRTRLGSTNDAVGWAGCLPSSGGATTTDNVSPLPLLVAVAGVVVVAVATELPPAIWELRRRR